MEIRKLVVAKGGLEAEMLDFLFGRPLVKTIESFGFRVRFRNQKIALVFNEQTKETKRDEELCDFQ